MCLNSRAFFLIPVIAFIVYANALGNGFVWDDNNLILENPILKDIRKMPAVFTKDLHYFTYEKSGFYRPLQTLSFISDHALWKRNPFGYHLTNILIHCANAILVYLLINLILNNITASFIASLLFAVHPIQTQAVTYVSGRADLLAAFFILLGMICYIKQRHLAMTTCCFILALMSKEIALVFPLLLILHDALFDKFQTVREFFKRYLPFILIAAVYVILRFTVLNFFEIQKGVFMYGTSWHERLFTFFKVMPTYLRLLITPTGLHMGWNVPLAKTFFDYKVIFGAFLIIAAGVLAIRSKDNLYKFAAGWFAICLLPSSNLLTPLNAVMAEHWLYLPSIGAFLVAAKGVVILRSKATKDLTGDNKSCDPQDSSPRNFEEISGTQSSQFFKLQRASRYRGTQNDKNGVVRMTKLIIYAAIGFIILIYSTLTFQRNKAWKDDIAIYSDTIKHSPNWPIVHYNLSNALRKEGRMDEALVEAKRALKLQPNFGRALNNLGSIYITKKMYQEAEESYRKAIAVIPNEKEPYSNMGYLYNLLGRHDEAIVELDKALSIDPEFAAALNNLGNSYLGKGDKDRAIELWKKSLAIDPYNKSSKENLNRLGVTVIANP